MMPLDLANNVCGSHKVFASNEESAIVQEVDDSEVVSAGSPNQPQISIIQQHMANIEDSRSPPSKYECTKLVLSLSREVAIYCCLNMSVGGASDCLSLREELRRLATKLFDLIMLCKRRLMPLLLSKRTKEEERVELERLYRIFSGCLEMLQAEFIRAITLQSVFPLWDSSTLLIQTGITEWMVTKKSLSKAMSGDQMSCSQKEYKNADLEEFLNLERKVTTLQELSYSTSQIMDIKPWDHTPDPEITKINMEPSEGAELELSPVEGGPRPKHRKCIILTLVIGSLVIVAGVLGLALALPNDDAKSSTPPN